MTIWFEGLGNLVRLEVGAEPAGVVGNEVTQLVEVDLPKAQHLLLGLEWGIDHPVTPVTLVYREGVLIVREDDIVGR